jgi:regulator of replication initiation timing
MPRNDTAEQRIATLKRARAEDAVRKRQYVADAIKKLTDNGSRVTFELVARRAGVSRQFLYGDKELRTAVEDARRQTPASPPPAITVDTDTAGLQTDLLLTREEITRLRAENNKLKTKLVERAASTVLDGQDETVRDLTTRNAELVRENAELRRQLADSHEDLDAARATNRDLMTTLNRHHPHKGRSDASSVEVAGE